MSTEPHQFKQYGNNSVCIHCGKSEQDVLKAPSRASRNCKAASGKVNAGRIKSTKPRWYYYD